jgi:RimJ/RimL family protein N-acetyltransferase
MRVHLAHVSKEDLRFRFFDSIKDFSHQFLAKLTEIDDLRAMAFAAIDESSGGMLGVVRLHTDPVHKTGEYAILLRTDLKGSGLGWDLMQLIIEYAKSKGLRRIDGQVLQENSVMLKMCRELGFKVKTDTKERVRRHSRARKRVSSQQKRCERHKPRSRYCPSMTGDLLVFLPRLLTRKRADGEIGAWSRR